MIMIGACLLAPKSGDVFLEILKWNNAGNACDYVKYGNINAFFVCASNLLSMRKMRRQLNISRLVS